MLSLASASQAAEYINTAAPWDYVYCGMKDGKTTFGSCSTPGRSVEIHKVRDTVIKFIYKMNGSPYVANAWFYAKQDAEDKNTYHVINQISKERDMSSSVTFKDDELVIFKTWKTGAPNDLENMTQETFFLTYQGD